MTSDRLTTVIGFLAALVVMAVVIWFIGFGDVVDALEKANTQIAALTVLAAAVWLSAWGLSLYTVLGALDSPVSAPKAIFVFSAAVFSNNITPFGQAGGEPVSAMLISTAADSEYETGLAAIASVDTLHFVPSIGLSVVGLGYVAVSTVTVTQNIILAMSVVAVLAAAVPVAAYIGWNHRAGIEQVVARVLTPLIQFVGRIAPLLSSPSDDVVTQRIGSFFDAVSRVATNRRTILIAMSFSAIGWLALSTSLWLALYSLGFVIPFPAILFVVPLGSIAGVTPLPGGTGGIETAFVVLMLPLGVPPALGTAAVLIHRGATYVLPTIFGGGAAAFLGAESRRIGE